MGRGMLGLVQLEAQPMKGLLWKEVRVSTTCQAYMRGEGGNRLGILNPSARFLQICYIPKQSNRELRNEL